MCRCCCGQWAAAGREEVSTGGMTVGVALQRRTVIETYESTSASRTASRRLSRPSPMTGASARGRDIVLAPPRPVYYIIFRFFSNVLPAAADRPSHPSSLSAHRLLVFGSPLSRHTARPFIRGQLQPSSNSRCLNRNVNVRGVFPIFQPPLLTVSTSSSISTETTTMQQPLLTLLHKLPFHYSFLQLE